MREIKGYVCRAKCKNNPRELLFGKNIGNGMGRKNYSNFETNNLTPYATLKEAKKALLNVLKISDVLSAKVQKIEMKLAETVDDCFLFENEKDLIVVWKDDRGNMNLRGPFVEGTGDVRSAVPGMPSIYNGYITFKSYSAAEYVLSEVCRQAQSPARFATFSLEDIT
jgi:hypothetical protein